MSSKAKPIIIAKEFIIPKAREGKIFLESREQRRKESGEEVQERKPLRI